MDSQQELLPPVVVPHGEVEAFVLREGTDYGTREASLDAKVADVLEQLRRGRAEIVFDPNLDSVSIVVKRDRPIS